MVSHNWHSLYVPGYDTLMFIPCLCYIDSHLSWYISIITYLVWKNLLHKRWNIGHYSKCPEQWSHTNPFLGWGHTMYHNVYQKCEKLQSIYLSFILKYSFMCWLLSLVMFIFIYITHVTSESIVVSVPVLSSQTLIYTCIYFYIPSWKFSFLLFPSNILRQKEFLELLSS